MAVTPGTFKTLFPEFAAQSDTRVQLFLDQASRRISTESFGTLYDDAQNYLTAHLIAVNIRASIMTINGASGPVASESVGSLSRAYVSNFGSTTGADNYNASIYGQEFQRILNLCFLTPLLAY